MLNNRFDKKDVDFESSKANPRFNVETNEAPGPNNEVVVRRERGVGEGGGAEAEEGTEGGGIVS